MFSVVMDVCSFLIKRYAGGAAWCHYWSLIGFEPAQEEKKKKLQV